MDFKKVVNRKRLAFYFLLKRSGNMGSDIKSIIDLFAQEVEFYKTENNSDWSEEKNLGFKEGLKYSYNLMQRVKPIFESGD